MSNYKKTLADVKPGGMVRLGDQALSTSEGARRYVADFFAKQLRRHDFGDYILTELAGDFACALAQHLSAQPSPGGQDAPFPWENFPAYLIDKCEGDTISEEGLQQALAAMAKDERYCLAARQPVGEPVPFAVESKAFEAHAASRKLNLCQHPLHYLFLDRATDEARHAWKAALAFAQPAQAVDLGAVRALLQRRIEQWRSHLPADPGAPGTREIETKGEPDYNNDVRIYREGIAVMEEVLSKIDSRTVQTAQAVDLGAVREAVRKAWQKCAAGDSVDLQFGTLLALIDGMAVGNG